MTRLLLAVLVLVFFLLCVAAMWWGWRNRARRQADYLPPMPEPPTDADDIPLLLPAASGVYIGTTTAGDWQDRIAVGDVGQRAAVTARLSERGLLLDRVGTSPLWIPADALVDARTDRALAGKVMGTDGLLVVRWRLGEHQLDSGFRGDDSDVYGEWVSAVRALAERSTREGDER